MYVDKVILAIPQITTLAQGVQLSTATGFFLRRHQRLFLVTNRHVLEADNHQPDQLMLALHTNAGNIAQITPHTVALYQQQTALWKAAEDSAGSVDVAVLEIDEQTLPPGCVIEAFSLAQLCAVDAHVALGTPVTIIGFPLGFKDELHNLPVARQGIVASPFGLRFGGGGYFLTDARTHRGSSGSPVLMSAPENPNFPWRLLGIHSARFDVNRDQQQDEALGLNCAWYVDVLEILTAT